MGAGLKILFKNLDHISKKLKDSKKREKELWYFIENLNKNISLKGLKERNIIKKRIKLSLKKISVLKIRINDYEIFLKKEEENILNDHNKYNEELREYAREYRQRPEVKKRMREYAREYGRRPEVKKKAREYYQRPEVNERMREYAREYGRRPEVKKKAREYYQRPEVKKRMREYYQRPEVKKRMREYYQRPEVKKRKREYYLSNKKKTK